jgi:hypothetical protein
MLATLLAIGLWSPLAEAAAPPLPWRFDRAEAVSVAPGGQPDWSQARELRLPNAWTMHWPGASGLVVYRLRFDAPQQPGEDLLALFIEQACNTLRVSLNGQWVHHGGRLDEPVTRQCQRPHLVPIASGLLKPVGNVLDITVRGYAPAEVGSSLRTGALSSVVLGPQELLAREHSLRTVLSTRLPEAISVTLVLLGGFMFLLGWFHRKQSYLAYIGVLMIGWAVLLSQLWLSDLPWSNRSTEILLVTWLGVVTMAGVQFLMRYGKRRLRW